MLGPAAGFQSVRCSAASHERTLRVEAHWQLIDPACLWFIRRIAHQPFGRCGDPNCHNPIRHNRMRDDSVTRRDVGEDFCPACRWCFPMVLLCFRVIVVIR
jgi:hypothetical protein